jgi:hypothetical protein
VSRPPITVRTIRVDNTFAARDQCFDLGQLGLLFLAAPARLGRCGDRDDETRAPLRPDQPPGRVEVRSKRTKSVLGRQRTQPAHGRLEPRLSPAPEVPALDRVERTRTERLGFLRGQMLPAPTTYAAMTRTTAPRPR